ncbi:hypothetical protein TNCV_1875371 [Trichonephila clavipes]|nr:hypothetical protein TNCV_1875371 [Trichonephila clavipes]
MLILMGIKIGPEAHAFTIKRDNILTKRSEIRASDASKEVKTTRLDERTSENAFLEVEEGSMYGTEIADKKKCMHKVPLHGSVYA